MQLTWVPEFVFVGVEVFLRADVQQNVGEGSSGAHPRHKQLVARQPHLQPEGLLERLLRADQRVDQRHLLAAVQRVVNRRRFLVVSGHHPDAHCVQRTWNSRENNPSAQISTKLYDKNVL
jgi:hypothetical protein